MFVASACDGADLRHIQPNPLFCGQVTAQPCLDCLCPCIVWCCAPVVVQPTSSSVHDSRLQQRQWHHSTRWPRPPHARDEARCFILRYLSRSHMRVAACDALTSSQSLSLCTQRQTDKQKQAQTQPLWGNPACNSNSRCQLQPHCGCTLRLPVVSCNAPSQPRKAGAGTRTHASQEQANCCCSGPRPHLCTRAAGPGLSRARRHPASLHQHEATAGGWPCSRRACKRHMTTSCDSNNSRHHHPENHTHQQPVTPPVADARCSCSGRTNTRAHQHTRQQLQHTFTPPLLPSLSLTHTHGVAAFSRPPPCGCPHPRPPPEVAGRRPWPPPTPPRRWTGPA